MAKETAIIESVNLFSATPATLDELRAYAATRGDAAKGENKIKNIRRLWRDDVAENFYLEGCLTAVMKAAGGNPRFDYPFFLALCGGFFTQTYSHTDGAEDRTAGFTTVFMPGLVKHVLNECGYACHFIDPATIREHPGLVMDVVKTAVDKGIPVIAKGIGNAQIGDTVHESLREWCNIGGYGENNTLWVNVYIDKIPTDENGYIEIKDGLGKSQGLFVLGEKTAEPEVGGIVKRAIQRIPLFVTMPDQQGFSFGQKAFYDWAEMLEDEGMDVGEAQGRNFASSVVQLTIAHYFRTHYNNLAMAAPDFELAQKVGDVFMKMQRVPKPKATGMFGMFASHEDMANPEFRRAQAQWARAVGGLHDELLALFKENNGGKNKENDKW